MMLKKALSIGLIFLVFLLWGNTLWIAAKAVLAQYLIESAWAQTLETKDRHYPWPWADTWPLAALYFPEQSVTLYALAGSHGSSLAFGPGHIDGTALPGETGTAVYSGHRDTHFRFLRHVNVGEVFSIQSADQTWKNYKIKETRVVNTNNQSWLIDNSLNEVHLITCYPFDNPGLNPDKRFIAIAQEIEKGHINRLSAME